MAGMGPCKRPGSTGEGTETPAYRRAGPAIRDQASARATDTGVCRLPGIGCLFDRRPCEARVDHGQT
jgi:hypothetical protein